MTNDDDDKGGVVIPWPGAKARTSEAPAGAGDAFDDAVRRALEAGGPASGAATPVQPEAPRSAEELVARVYSALSGTDADAALAAVREQAGAAVIDLQAAREARQRAATATPEVGRLLAESFRAFVKELANREGRTEVVLDGAFFRQHGTALLGNLFKGLAGAMTRPPRPPDPTSMTEGGPARPGPSERAVDAPPIEPGQSATHEVRIRVDLGSLLKSLFTRRSEPPAETPPTPKDPE